MRPVPAFSVVAAAVLCGAFTGACSAPAPATHASHHDTLRLHEAPAAAQPAPAPTTSELRLIAEEHERRLATIPDPTHQGGAYIVYSEEPPSAPPASPALLWLALAVPVGVGYRLVVAMIEGRQAHIVLLACASLFLSGLVLIGA